VKNVAIPVAVFPGGVRELGCGCSASHTVAERRRPGASYDGARV